MTHGERSTNREYTASYVRLKGGQEMRFSGWNRHFKKTDPSIHRETIKLIARHHASNWRCSVPLRAVPRRAACFFFGAVLSLAWKNSSSEMLMTTTAAPTIFFSNSNLSDRIVASVSAGDDEKQRIYMYVYTRYFSVFTAFARRK